MVSIGSAYENVQPGHLGFDRRLLIAQAEERGRRVKP